MQANIILPIGCIIVALSSWSAQGCGFRLSSGKLLSCGMQRAELVALAGQPGSKDIETLGVDNGEPVKGETIETWSYQLRSDMDHDYLVSVTIQASKVTAIWTKQLNRL